MWRMLRIDRTIVVRKLGRRGLILVLIGIIWILVGVNIYQFPIERFSRPGPGGVLEFMEKPYIGLLWAIAGIIAVATGILHYLQRVAERDAIGYNALLTPALVWTLCFFWSWAAYLFGAGGNERSLAGLLAWATISLFILVIAGWPEIPEQSEKSDRW